MKHPRPESLPADVSLAELQYLLGLSKMRISQLTDTGIITRIARGRYSLDSVPAVLRHMREVGAGPRDWQAARTQLMREKLALLRMQRLERAGALVPEKEMIEVHSVVWRWVRDRMLAIGVKLAPRLAAESRPAGCQLLVEVEIRQALEDASRLEIVPGKAKGNEGIDDVDDEDTAA
jgi:hypothetical protein